MRKIFTALKLKTEKKVQKIIFLDLWNFIFTYFSISLVEPRPLRITIFPIEPLSKRDSVWGPALPSDGTPSRAMPASVTMSRINKTFNYCDFLFLDENVYEWSRVGPLAAYVHKFLFFIFKQCNLSYLKGTQRSTEIKFTFFSIVVHGSIGTGMTNIFRTWI